MNEILVVNDLSKQYGRQWALNQVNLTVDEGSILGLLGPNGSGKTTLLSIAMNVTKPTSGHVKWFGRHSTAQIRRNIGTLLETPNFYDYLSAENNLKIAAKIKQVDEKDIARVLTIVDLSTRKKDKFKTFSLGMKQRLAIASALLGKPKVLVLDEPTNGLDPQGIAEIRQLIQQIAENQVTIILASHMLDEVEKVCTDVAIIKQGNLLMQGAVNNILSDDNMLEVSASNIMALKEVLGRHTLIHSVKESKEGLRVSCESTLTPEVLNQYCFENHITLTHIVKKKKSLEAQFLEVTQS